MVAFLSKPHCCWQSYDGAWVNDMMHGEGIFRYASKAKFEGSWVENKYAGQGKYTWPSGDGSTIIIASTKVCRNNSTLTRTL